MSAVVSSPTWRHVLVTVAAVGAFGLVLLAAPSDAQTVPSADAQTTVSGLAAAVEDHAVRPFHINVPDEALVDLRRRIAATRWPDRETVNDRSQGVQLANIQELVRYWGTDYDWRQAEAKLNAWPQFMTTMCVPQLLGAQAQTLLRLQGEPGAAAVYHQVLEPFPTSAVAAEAQYSAAVALYKHSHQAPDVLDPWRRLQTQDQSRIWRVTQSCTEQG